MIRWPSSPVRRPRWRTAWRSDPRGRRGRRGCRPRSRRPPDTTPTRSARSAVERRWAITTTVRPSMRRSMACSTSSSVPGSRLTRWPRRAPAAPGRPARPGPATRVASPPPRAASRARAPRCRVPGAAPQNRSSTPTAAQRLVDLGVGGVAPGDADVLADRAVEEEALLGHDHDPLPQRPLGGVAQVGRRRSVTAPLGRVVQPGHELGQRRLAGAGRPHQGQPLPGGDGERRRRAAPGSDPA